VKTPFTQYTIIPETKVSGSSHSGLIQIWLDINYSGLEEIEEVPLLAQTFDIDFAFTSYEDFDGTNKDIKKIAWIPSWGMNTALEVLSRDPTYYSTLSPVWFKPNDNGTLQELPTTNNTSLMSLANQYDLDIVPTVALVGEDDKDTLHEILNGNIDQHVNSIVQKVEDYGYDGIDLDYEWTYSNPPNEEDPELLIELLTKLKQELGNKTLSFTVLPQWGDQIKYGYKPQTHEAQDWKKIGEIADEVRIMIYDYRGTGSSVPGPTAPYPWYLGVLRYAQSKIPNEKIILGIPLYGYSWKLNNTDSLSFPSDHTQGQTTYTLLEEYKNNPLASSAVMTSEGHAVMPITAYAQEDYMTHYGVNDNWNKEQVSVYYLGGWWYTSYLSKEDVNTRIETAENAGVGGVAFWRLVEF
jgi:spore germination protein YaaH